MKSTNNPLLQIEKAKLEAHLASLIRQPLHEFIVKIKLPEVTLDVQVHHKDGGEILNRTTSVKIIITIL